MSRTIVQSQVDGNGVLHIDIPLGPAAASQFVQVTIESVAQGSSHLKSWRDWIDGIAGAWKGEVELPARASAEEREQL